MLDDLLTDSGSWLFLSTRSFPSPLRAPLTLEAGATCSPQARTFERAIGASVKLSNAYLFGRRRQILSCGFGRHLFGRNKRHEVDMTSLLCMAAELDQQFYLQATQIFRPESENSNAFCVLKKAPSF